LFLAVAPAAVAQDEAWRRAGWCRSDYDATPPPRLNLPGWACKAAFERRVHETYEVHEGMNPFFLSGDFDGDGQADIAVWIANRRSKQLGVAIIHRATRAVTILAAGRMGDRGDDWRGLDQWTLHPKGPLKRSPDEGPRAPKLRGDALWIAKSESGSFFVYWDGQRYRYYQEGD
jgi:hypothetical protein